MAKNDNAWTQSLSRIIFKIIFLSNRSFLKNYGKGVITIHWLEAKKLTFINFGVTSELVLCLDWTHGHDEQ